MTRLSDGRFGREGKRLADLSDAELHEELTWRRRKRRPASGEGHPPFKRVKQYLANLELTPNATWPEVERAYKRLRDRYDPGKHEGHPERHQTAVELSESLKRAYEALRGYFGVK